MGLAALVLSVISITYQRRRDASADWSKRINDSVKPFEGLPEAVSEMHAELQVLKKQVEVFWRGVSYSSAAALHSPHTKELDELLEKFQRDEIQSERDLAKLKTMLQDVAENDTNPSRRKYALDILTLIHVRFEIGGDLVTAMRRSN